MTGIRLLFASLLSATVSLASGNVTLGREQVGVVLGKAIFSEPVSASDDDESSKLRALFIAPLVDKYRVDHPSACANKDEVDRCWEWLKKSHGKAFQEVKQDLMDRLKVIDRELAKDKLSSDTKKQLLVERTSIQIRLNGPDHETAQYIADQWKFQRTIYDKFEGGRILFQQGGVEAFDATRKWLEQAEKRGDIVFETPAIRAAVFKYWSQDHGTFLTRDPTQIKAFLEPEWLQKP